MVKPIRLYTLPTVLLYNNAVLSNTQVLTRCFGNTKCEGGLYIRPEVRSRLKGAAVKYRSYVTQAEERELVEIVQPVLIFNNALPSGPVTLLWQGA